MMQEKTNLDKLWESVDQAKRKEKRTNRNFIWFILIPIAFVLGWFSFSVSSIKRIDEQKNIIEKDKKELAQLVQERDSLLLVIKNMLQKETAESAKDSTIKAFINTALRLNERSYSDSYAIVSASDRDLPSAQWEAGKFKKNGIENVVIFYRNKMYRTVVYPLTKQAANAGLNTVKEKFNSTAYIVNINDWCPEWTQKEGYYECK